MTITVDAGTTASAIWAPTALWSVGRVTVGAGSETDCSGTKVGCGEYSFEVLAWGMTPVVVGCIGDGGLWSLISVKIRSSSYDDCHRFWSSVFDCRQHADFNAVLSFQFFRCVLTTELHLVVSIQVLPAHWFQCSPQFSVFSLCADGQTHIRSLTTELHLVVSIQCCIWHGNFHNNYMKLLSEPARPKWWAECSLEVRERVHCQMSNATLNADDQM